MEVGGTFAFLLNNGTVNSTSLIGWQVIDTGYWNSTVASGTGTSFSHVWTSAIGGAKVRFFNDRDGDGQCSTGYGIFTPEKYVDSKSLTVQDIKERSVTVRYSQRIPSLGLASRQDALAAVRTALDGNVARAFTRDSSDDYRACFRYVLNDTVSDFQLFGPDNGTATTSGTMPDPADTAAKRDLHTNTGFTFSLLNQTTPTLRGEAAAIGSPLCSVISWNIMYGDTMIHEYLHGLGYTHFDSDPMRIICGAYVPRSTSANKLSQPEANSLSE